MNLSRFNFWRTLVLLGGLLGLRLTAPPAVAGQQPAGPLTLHWLALDGDETPQVADADYPAMRVAVTPFGPSGAPLAGLAPDAFQLRVAGDAVSDLIMEPYAAAEQPISVALLLDTSAAMQPYLDQVKTAVPALYDLLEQTDESALLPFSSPVNLDLDPAADLGFTNDEGALINLLNAQTAAGNADWADAVQKGLRLAAGQAAHKRRAVILLSAGGADRGAETAVAEAQRLGVPVFAIGLGAESPHTALATVAAQTGGTFVPADSAEALRAAFRAVTGQLRQVYSLRFTANLPADGGVHPLELTVQTPQGTAVSTAQFMARFPLIPAVRGVTAFVPEPAALPDLDWVRGRVTLQPDVVARNEITAVNYYVDGGQTAVFTASTAPWTFSWDTSDLAPGQTHTLLIEIVDAANPPHVGVYETAVFVHACPLACQIAQNSLLAGVLAAGVLGLGGLAVFWLVKSRSAASRQPTAVASAPVARTGARRPSEAVVMMKQPDPLPLVSASTIVDDERPLVLQPPGLQGEGWPADLPTLDTQTAPSAASSAADFPRTEILAPNDGTIALAFLVDLNAGLEHRLAARTTLGSAPDCDIILRDPSVAAHHARISWEDKKFALFATTAQYGLQVNGRDIIHAVLRSGDRLQIGRFTFVFKSIQ